MTPVLGNLQFGYNAAQQLMTRYIARLLFPLFALAFCGCGILPRKVTMDDPRIKPLLAAAASFPRADYGFTPLPVQADVRWESRPRAGYDAMLHLTSKTYRTVAFRRDATRYRWVGEQETFTGPHKYETVDGTFNEEIVLTYETEHISGAPLNRLYIPYQGDDARLSWPRVLTLADARAVLKQWGYWRRRSGSRARNRVRTNYGRTLTVRKNKRDQLS